MFGTPNGRKEKGRRRERIRPPRARRREKGKRNDKARQQREQERTDTERSYT